MSSTYRSLVLAQRPVDAIVPGETFKIVTQPAPTEADLKDGEVLLRALYLSLDPAMRGWISDRRSYLPPVGIGEVMRGVVVGQALASKAAEYPAGSYAVGMVGCAELAIANAEQLYKIEMGSGGSLTDALGVLGVTGLTAHFGVLDIGRVKAGDFVVVSGAAGATGSVAGQIAKLKGARVLGLAGSDDKVKWLKELGFDDALNYKDPDFKKNFRAATSSLIDVFFDNVGGEILDLALERAKEFSRFVMCGGISQYNTSNPKGPKNIMNITKMRIRMEGFIVFDYVSRWPEARRELAQWLSEGKIQGKDTILRGGLPAVEQGMIDLFKGINTGKLLVEIAAPKEANVSSSL